MYRHIKLENCSVFLWEGRQEGPIVYSHMSLERAMPVWQTIKESGITLAAIDIPDWNRSLSPWKAPALMSGDEDFSGCAEQWLENIEKEIIPIVENGRYFKFRVIAGYSLAGLFALWGSFNSTSFERAASASGSLWFDGFEEYMAKGSFKSIPKKVYLSLGDAEKNTKNGRMSKVEDKTIRIINSIKSQGTEIFFEMNKGGHFKNVSQRTARAFLKICQ